jgi:Lon protease-like protein
MADGEPREAELGAAGYLGVLEPRAEDRPPLDAQLSLPLLITPQVVLFPGATLPLREHAASPRFAMLDALLRGSGEALLACACDDPQPGEVCCVARIERAARLQDDATELVAVARGIARAELLSLSASSGYTPLATLQVLRELDRPQQPPLLSAHAATSVWRAHRPDALAARLRSAPALMALTAAAQVAGLSPAELSWHAASKLPLDVRERRALLQEESTTVRLLRLLAVVGDGAVLRCASCSTLWADGKHILATGATGAFVNPHGYVHDMVVVEAASNLFASGPPVARDSWFPGFAWQIAHCLSCFSHAGWLFTAMPTETRDAVEGAPATHNTNPLPRLPPAFWGLRQGSFTHDAAADGRDA